MKQLAQEALDIQNACNPLGLTKGFAQATQELWEHAVIGSSIWETTKHPVFQLWASKIHEIAGMGLSDGERYGIAYHMCLELAAGKKETEASAPIHAHWGSF
jgi:hypothetical protein